MKTKIITLTGLLILSISTKGQFGASQAKDNTLLVKGTAILKQIPEIIYDQLMLNPNLRITPIAKINYWPKWIKLDLLS